MHPKNYYYYYFLLINNTAVLLLSLHSVFGRLIILTILYFAENNSRTKFSIEFSSFIIHYLHQCWNIQSSKWIVFILPRRLYLSLNFRILERYMHKRAWKSRHEMIWWTKIRPTLYVSLHYIPQAFLSANY